MRVVRWTSLNPEEQGESKSGGGGECCPRMGNKKQPNDRKAVPKLACAVGSFKTSSPQSWILHSSFPGLLCQAVNSLFAALCIIVYYIEHKLPNMLNLYGCWLHLRGKKIILGVSRKLHQVISI